MGIGALYLLLAVSPSVRPYYALGLAIPIGIGGAYLLVYYLVLGYIKRRRGKAKKP